jgi:hypothetical protein
MLQIQKFAETLSFPMGFRVDWASKIESYAHFLLYRSFCFSEIGYEVSYSAARWPSGTTKLMECEPNDDLCMEKYRKNAAMIQVFYEELNYETLTESPAYTASDSKDDSKYILFLVDDGFGRLGWPHWPMDRRISSKYTRIGHASCLYIPSL